MFHNLSQKQRDIIALLKMLHETGENLKYIFCLIFDKFRIKQTAADNPSIIFCVERKLNLPNNLTFLIQVFDEIFDKGL